MRAALRKLAQLDAATRLDDGRIDLIPQPGGLYVARSAILPLVLLTKPPPEEVLGGLWAGPTRSARSFVHWPLRWANESRRSAARLDAAPDEPRGLWRRKCATSRRHWANQIRGRHLARGGAREGGAEMARAFVRALPRMKTALRRWELPLIAVVSMEGGLVVLCADGKRLVKSRTVK
jgi:hypothetical protein